MSKTYTQSDIVTMVRSSDKAAMRAVCAIFRSQTADEKVAETTKHDNSVGFSQSDAKAGTDMAKWMSRGLNDGQFRRSVGGATKFGSHWINRIALCRLFAIKYRRQLTELANKNAARAARAA